MALSVLKNGGTCSNAAVHDQSHATRSSSTAIRYTDDKRDFLLFIPVSEPNLHAVFSYFSATMKVNPEGDVIISDDTIQGLGTAQQFLQCFFGSIILVARTPPYSSSSNYIAPLEMATHSSSKLAISETLPPRPDEGEIHFPLVEVQTGLLESFGTMLIGCVPNPGYFVAGGVAGIVSRTSTAPLDRLKVYLIAQTSVAEEAVAAAKHGNIFRAALNAWRPLATATKELWEAGGMRSLYAGKYRCSLLLILLLTDSSRQWSECSQSHARISHQIWFLRGKYECNDTNAAPNLCRLQNESSPRSRDIVTQQLYIPGPNLLPAVLQVSRQPRSIFWTILNRVRNGVSICCLSY